MSIAQPWAGPTADRGTLVRTSSLRPISRRSALVRAAIATGGLAASGSVLAACTGDSGVTEATRTAQQLSSLSLAASVDAAAARTLIARNADRAAALAVIAAERQTHATVLNDEIARLAPDIARPSTASGVPTAPLAGSATSSPSTGTSAAPAAPAVTTVDELRQRLESATTTTGDLAVTMSGYRAGMLGSIAAALSAEVEVQLA